MNRDIGADRSGTIDRPVASRAPARRPRRRVRLASDRRGPARSLGRAVDDSL